VDVLEFKELVLEPLSDEYPDIVQDQPQNEGVLSFPNAQELMNYVTPRWRERFVVSNICDKHVLDELSVRPCFILISVDAPVYTRWIRCMRRYLGA
jgi:dCMP deaminase